MRIILCFFFFSLTSIQALAQQYDGVERVVVIGDVHGAYDALVPLLQAQGLIDDALDWQGEQTHLVSLGDLLDRGAKSKQALDLLMKLQPQAEQAGGRVHVVLGNHEVMNLSGDLRDVSQAEFDALEPLGGHSQVFSEHGIYGTWLLSLPFVIRINDSIFTHGGLASHLRSMSIEDLNQRAHDQLLTVLQQGKSQREKGLLPPRGDLLTAHVDLPEAAREALSAEFLAAVSSPLLGENSPQWYRGNAACHSILEAPQLAKTLKAFAANRVIIGHTPTPDRQVNSRLDGLVYAIDSGMLKRVYHGNPRGLILQKGQPIQAFGPQGITHITIQPQTDPIEALKDSASVQVDTPSHESNEGVVYLAREQDKLARFVPLRKRARNKALAAYTIDRMLNLHMVPATAATEVNGRTGIIMQWGKHRSESDRGSTGINRPNYCEKHSDFRLLAAFDALIGKLDRHGNNLWYQRSDWQIRITENHTGFSSQARLPKYATQPILPNAMARELEALTQESLSQALAGLLKKSEIKALLKRRDAILQWPAG